MPSIWNPSQDTNRAGEVWKHCNLQEIFRLWMGLLRSCDTARLQGANQDAAGEIEVVEGPLLRWMIPHLSYPSDCGVV